MRSEAKRCAAQKTGEAEGLGALLQLRRVRRAAARNALRQRAGVTLGVTRRQMAPGDDDKVDSASRYQDSAGHPSTRCPALFLSAVWLGATHAVKKCDESVKRVAGSARASYLPAHDDDTQARFGGNSRSVVHGVHSSFCRGGGPI